MARRYSAVPWLDDADLHPAGWPEATVSARADEIAHSLRIRAPFGLGTDTVLTVHAYRASGHIFAAETDAHNVVSLPEIEPAQSNPNRTGDEGED